MHRQKFKLWHSVLGAACIIAFEALLLFVFHVSFSLAAKLILIASIAGSLLNLYVATEIIEEVRGAAHMLWLLSAVVLKFVVFFAFQYWFLLAIQSASFPMLAIQPLTLLLHSTMIFVFNPLYLPGTLLGQALLLIQTFAALGLVLFILQNVGQFHHRAKA